MTRRFTIPLAVAVIALSGCASSAPPAPPAPAPAVRSAPGKEMRRLAVVPTGESAFTVAGGGSDVSRVFEEVGKWHPKAAVFVPLVRAVQAAVDWLTAQGRAAGTAPHVRDVDPRTVVTDAFARALMASGRFDQVRLLEGEPTGDERRQTDELVRVMVPSWGLVRVREGKPDLHAAYADVRAQMVVRPTGAVVWEHDEDVTHPERLPLATFRSDAAVARRELMDVLERAGQRLASEFLYARSGAR